MMLNTLVCQGLAGMEAAAYASSMPLQGGGGNPGGLGWEDLVVPHSATATCPQGTLTPEMQAEVTK